jgi:hypothetical protein
MWADYYLRPNGEVVVVGEDIDHPDMDTVHTDRLTVLRTLVWGSERYPELRELLPRRGLHAIDCKCLQHPEFFGRGKFRCGDCGGIGWIEPTDR